MFVKIFIFFIIISPSYLIDILLLGSELGSLFERGVGETFF